MTTPLIIASESLVKKTLITPFGTFTFEKLDRAARFIPLGGTGIIILPKHGDLDCPCNSCSAYRLVHNEEADGWRLTNFSESFSSLCEKEELSPATKQETDEERLERQRMAPILLEQRLLDIAQIQNASRGEKLKKMLAETDLSDIFNRFCLPKEVKK